MWNWRVADPLEHGKKVRIQGSNWTITCQLAIQRALNKALAFLRTSPFGVCGSTRQIKNDVNQIEERVDLRVLSSKLILHMVQNSLT